MEIQNGKCILVCAGDFSMIDPGREEGDLLIAVDNGLSYLEQMGILPDMILGDFDSLEEGRKALLDEFEMSRPGSVIRLPVHKDDTDTLHAIRVGLEKGYRRFQIYGAMGGRLDHTLSNIQTLHFISDQGARGYMLDEKCMLTVFENDTVKLHAGFQGTVSLFALDEKAEHVTIRGLEYEIEDAELTNTFPIGCSNSKQAGQEAYVTAGDGAVLLYAQWQS